MNWPTVKLGEVCTLTRGCSPTMRTPEGPYPFVVTAAYRRTANSYQFDRPAVCVPLISSTGHGDAAIHRVHFQDGKFAVANLLVALQPKNPAQCDCKYLYHLLQARKDELLVTLMQGTANVSLKERDIAGVRISLPPVAEQRRIVARVDAITGRLAEAKRLRAESDADCDNLLVAMAHRGDLDDAAKERAGWKRATLSDGIRLVSDPVPVDRAASYPNLGIYSYARGLFEKPPIEGLSSSANTLYRVRAGQFIYSRLFAFEGAYGLVPGELDGRYVSNEYPTFEADPSRLRTAFVAAYFKSPQVWKDVAVGSVGIGHRRQRVHPEQILQHQVWVPPLDWQDAIAAVQAKADTLRRLQAELAAELDALLPAVLAKAFAGEL